MLLGKSIDNMFDAKNASTDGEETGCQAHFRLHYGFLHQEVTSEAENVMCGTRSAISRSLFKVLLFGWSSPLVM